VDNALSRIIEFSRLTKNPYIAFSMGKDSTVALHLTRKIIPNCKAIYIDANCAFPEAYQLLENTPNAEKFPAQEDFLDTLERMGGVHGGRELENETMRTTVTYPVKQLVSMGYDGQVVGLRADENRGRFMNFKVHGAVYYHNGYGAYTCQPIADWSYDDVWAYIFSNGIDYCKTYDKMWELPREWQRISYWAGETARRYGRWAWLRINYPDLFSVLLQRFPDASNYT
jgi:3'-phosphoadenosine 5'-phosphosulfate sulfotransferase (PAPS reductase)/FAD synthetase